VTPDPAAVEHYRQLLAGQRPDVHDTYAFRLVMLLVSDAARAHAAGDDPGPVLARALAVDEALDQVREATIAALRRTAAELRRTVGELGDERAH